MNFETLDFPTAWEIQSEWRSWRDKWGSCGMVANKSQSILQMAMKILRNILRMT